MASPLHTRVVDEANHLKEELERYTELYKTSQEELSQKNKENKVLADVNKTLKAKLETEQMKCAELMERENLLLMGLQKKSAETENLREELAKERQQASNHSREFEEQRQENIDTILKLHQSRKEMCNQILDLKGNIWVVCRVRPLLKSETEKESLTFLFPDETTLKIAEDTPAGTSHNAKEQKSFSFDRVFGPDSTQDDIYSELSLLVQSALDGYNVCVFAYGRTGSGKSFTMADHIPFRDSTLTHLLMPSLTGNSKTLMMVNVSPCKEFLSDTLRTLVFALTISDVHVHPKRQMESGVKKVAKYKPHK